MAVNLFGGVDPEHFEVFDKAFITLFFVTAGDPWPDTLPKLREDGSADWVTAGYVIVFTVTVVWIFVEVASAHPLSRSACRGVRVGAGDSVCLGSCAWNSLPAGRLEERDCIASATCVILTSHGLRSA